MSGLLSLTALVLFFYQVPEYLPRVEVFKESQFYLQTSFEIMKMGLPIAFFPKVHLIS